MITHKLLIISIFFISSSVLSVDFREKQQSVSFSKSFQYNYEELMHFKYGETNYFPEVEWSPDSSRIVSISRDKIPIWDARTGELLLVIDNLGATSLSWSPDGTMIAGGGGVQGWDADLPVGNYEGDAAWIWDSRTGGLIAHFIVRYSSGDIPHLSSIAWGPSGTMLAAGGSDGAIHLWDVQTNKELQDQDAPLSVLSGPSPYVNFIAWSPDGTRLGVADYCGLDIWDVDENGLKERESQSLFLDPALINQPCENFVIAWHPDGELLASIGEDSSIIRIWDLDTEQPLLTFGEDERWVDLDWSPDGAILASVSENGAVIFWDAETGDELTQLPIRDAASFAWNPNGSQFAVGENDGTIAIWSAAGNGN